MRRRAIAALTVAAVMGLGYVHPFGNPRAEPAKGLGTLLQGANIPADAKAVLVTKCADCHSSETRWPVYARVAPGSWLIERDIVEARKKMDLSRWEEMPAEKQEVLTAKIIKADVQALSMLGKSGGGSEAALAGAGDAAHGKSVFEKRCTGCHAMETNTGREGPQLGGVFGRKAGSVAGFAYSAGLKNSGLTWTDATLEKWMSDPDLMVPDNKMSFSVPKAEERRDLIAYFKQ